VPESSNGHAPSQNRAPTPSRNIPSLQTLLNSSNANDYSPSAEATTANGNTNGINKSPRANSRSGSRSPTNPQHPQQEYHRMNDAQAVAKLNSGFANAP